MEFNNSIENQVKQETSKSTEKTKKGGKSGSYFNMLWELLPSKNKSKICADFSVSVVTLLGGRISFHISKESLNETDFIYLLKNEIEKIYGNSSDDPKENDLVANNLISEIEIIPMDTTPFEVIPKIIFCDPSFSQHWINLRKFQLEQNGLTQIPYELFQLTRLHELNLGNNLIKSIPKEIEKLQELVLLHLHNNKIPKIGKHVYKLTNLKYFWISNNLLTVISNEIGNLKSLVTLHLQRNRLSTIPSELNQLVCLETLNLSHNQITVIPPTCFETLTKLRNLNLENNKLSFLPCTIGGLISLEELNFNSNLITSLPEEFKNLITLNKLYMGDNKITLLGDSLTPLTLLTELSIAGNKNITNIPEVSRLVNLVHLDISQNNFQNIPDIYPLTNLTYLKMGKNCIQQVPSSISKLTNLQHLLLESNQIMALPTELGLLVQLRELDVSFNSLKVIPRSIENLSFLEKFYVNNNQLTSIPPTISSLQSLNILHLHNNPIINLPPSILLLTSLTEISVANVQVHDVPNEEVIILKENSTEFIQFLNIIRTAPHPLLMLALSLFSIQKKYHEIFLDISILSDILYIAKENTGKIRLEATKTIYFLSDSSKFRVRFIEEGALPALMYLIKENESSIVTIYCLQAIGNLGFEEKNRPKILSDCGIQFFQELMNENLDEQIRKQAHKILNILGCNELVHPPMSKKGLRILSLDGGGIRALVSLRIMTEIEKLTGKRIYELFDLIGGTSAGGCLSISLGAKLKSLEECREMNINLSNKIFSTTEFDSSLWSTTFARMTNGLNMVTSGSYYNKSNLEQFFKKELGEEYLIDTSAEFNAKKVFVTGTLQSVFPPEIFLFRNYQYPIDSSSTPSRYKGSSTNRVFEALRATTAAPSYFDEFIDEQYGTFLDGGILANNPVGIAIHEARKIWPNTNIDCIVSIGTGKETSASNTNGITIKGLILSLIEGATDTENLSNLLSDLLSPTVYFRFQPIHPAMRCKLDETRKERIEELEQAANEYVEQNASKFEQLAKRLLEGLE